MTNDIIHLLPDSIANQIAAGEVIQRPASVVKELIENALDAEATQIQLIIKDAGRTLIQVIDNGKGMSMTDARMAFERHATSKIKKAQDLFNLHTMGFRGEALASIAAIAHVELKTKRAEDEIGTHIVIAGSNVETQEAITCPTGSNFLIKNIFYNVPARRKFLKSNETEKRHILTELERVALVKPDIEFVFMDNDVESLHLMPGNLKQRIVGVLGKSLNQQLMPVEVETSIVKITGFISKPEAARKARALQYFFVNGRYMRHPYFGKAVQIAYEQLLPNGDNPNYFIYLEVAPDTIDINIHPTKTEIKFENERPIFEILMATVKEALGKLNAVPSIDFDTQDAIDIPIHNPSQFTPPPQIKIDPSYNPFNSHSQSSYQRKNPSFNWEKIYGGAEDLKKNEDVKQYTDIFSSVGTSDKEIQTTEGAAVHYQLKNKYILTSIKSGLMIINQHRAHVRILYDLFLANIKQKKGASQGLLFPERIDFSPSEAAIIPYLLDDFEAVGFSLSSLGNNTYSICGVPSELGKINPVDMLHKMVETSVELGSDVKEEIQEILALSMAKATAIPYGQKMSQEETTDIVDRLFALPEYSRTPDGKKIIATLSEDYIDKLFK